MPVTISRPRTLADQFDRGDEGLAEPVVDRRRQRVHAAGFGFQRAHRRCDQGAGALDFGAAVRGVGLAMEASAVRRGKGG